MIIVTVSAAVLFMAMGASHFFPSVARTMGAMIPPVFVGRRVFTRRFLVRFTGVCEIAGGAGLLVPVTRVAAAIALVAFLIAVFPANAYAARHKDRFGAVAIAFWPRLIGQLVLIAVVGLAATA